MDFKTFYQGLSPGQRQAFAARVGTSVGYCHQIAYGTKHIELGLADAMVAASADALTLDDLPLTARAKFQRDARQRTHHKGGKSRPPKVEQKAA